MEERRPGNQELHLFVVMLLFLIGTSEASMTFTNKTLYIGVLSDSITLLDSIHDVVITSHMYANVTNLTLVTFPFIDSMNPLTTLAAMPNYSVVPEPTLLIAAVTRYNALNLVISQAVKASLPLLVLPPVPCAGPCLRAGNNGNHTQGIVTIGELHPSAVSAISYIVSSRWERVIIFYEPGIDYQALVDDAQGRFSQDNVSTTVFSVQSEEDAYNALLETKLQPGLMSPFVVFCSTKTSTHILQQAMLLNLRRREYFWHIYSPATMAEELEPILKSSDNILVLQHPGMEVLGDAVGHYTREILNTIAGSSLNLEESGVYERLIHLVKNVSESPAVTEFVYPQWEVYSSVHEGGKTPQFLHQATWWSDSTFEQRGDLFPNFYNKLNNRTFTVVTVEYAFFQKKEIQKDGSVKWVGLTFELLNELARDLNFRYEVLESPDGAYGIADENGTWNGMVGMVMRREVDFAAAVFSVTAARKEVIRFCQAFYHDDSAVIIRKPSGENKLLLYLKPFKDEVWFMIVTATACSGVLLWAMSRFSPYYPQVKGWDVRKSTYEGLAKIKHSMLYITGAVVQQGGFYLPDAQSGRVLVGCFWFFAIVIVATYTGNLIAFLAVQQLQLPFNSLEEMVAQSAVEWGTATGVALVMLFRDANFEPYISVHKGNKKASSYGEGLQRVKEENFAFIAEESWYNAEAAKDCNLAMMKETFYPTDYSMVFHKDNDYVRLIDDRIIKMRESGILEKWTQTWTPQNLNCTGLKSITQAKVVTLDDFQGALILLAFGVVASILILLCEQLFNYCVQRRKRRKAEHDLENGIQFMANSIRPATVKSWT